MKKKPSPQSAAAPGSGDKSTGVDMRGLEKSVGYSLRRAQFSTYAAFSAAMEPLDIRPSQFAVLVLIGTNPGLSQAAICSALGIQKTNFVGLLDKLEERGLTERRKLPDDRRASALYLTCTGQAFVARMQSAHDAMEDAVAQRLGPERTRDLLDTLHEFASKSETNQLEEM